MPMTSVRNNRLLWLVVALMVVSAAPLLEPVLCLGIDETPRSWEQLMVSRTISSALTSVPIGLLLTLSFWVGMGRQSIFKRLLGGLVGTAYVSFWPELLSRIEWSKLPPGITVPWEEHVTRVLANVVIVALFGAAFMALRRWWKLDRAPSTRAEVAGKMQFSLLAILLVMTGSAVLMAGVRASRDSVSENGEGWVTTVVVLVALCFANLVGAAFAALSPYAVRRYCLMALGTSALLGIAMAIATGEDENSWWYVDGSLPGLVPAAIVILSLLAVRSAGYRLVRKGASEMQAEVPG
jgi:hypothetical protein